MDSGYSVRDILAFIIIAAVAFFVGLYLVATIGIEASEPIDDPNLSLAMNRLKESNKRKRQLSDRGYVGSIILPGDSSFFPRESGLVLKTEKSIASGDSLVVTGLQINEPSWVVVHEADGERWRAILGAALFEKNSTSGVVELLRDPNTNDRFSYSAVLHKDNGDRRFDFQTDLPYIEQGSSHLIESLLIAK